MRSDVSADDGNWRFVRSPSSHELRSAALAPIGLPTVAGIASESWWSQTGSNRRPHACKARALPAELWPRNQKTNAFDALASAGGTARRPSFKEACRAE